MVTVKTLALILFIIVQGSVSKPQEAADSTTAAPTPTVKVEYVYDYHVDDYDKQYDDYVKQYTDYVNTYGDYVTQQYGDYVTKQYTDYVTAYYTDYVTEQYTDYGDYENVWQYGSDFVDLDDDYGPHDYGEYFVFGDRNNPLDTVVQMFDDTGLSQNGSQMPWVYIIVPVIEVDVFYVEDHDDIDDLQMQLPIETFFFELGDFGMGHFDLGDFGLSDFGFDDVHHQSDSTLDYAGNYDDYPLYGNYQGNKASLYASGEELDDFATLDYPGIDHEPYWIDWIFMIPPDDPVIPQPGPVHR